MYLLHRLLHVKHHRIYASLHCKMPLLPHNKPLWPAKAASSSKALFQLQDLELSQAQHEREATKDRKYDRRHCLIQQHI